MTDGVLEQIENISHCLGGLDLVRLVADLSLERLLFLQEDIIDQLEFLIRIDVFTGKDIMHVAVLEEELE